MMTASSADPSPSASESLVVVVESNTIIETKDDDNNSKETKKKEVVEGSHEEEVVVEEEGQHEQIKNATEDIVAMPNGDTTPSRPARPLVSAGRKLLQQSRPIF